MILQEFLQMLIIRLFTNLLSVLQDYGLIEGISTSAQLLRNFGNVKGKAYDGYKTRN